MLKSRDHLQGVLVRKQKTQMGQKPCCRIHMGVVAIGNKFFTHGGSSANVFNDIRSLDSHDFEWKVLKEDGDMPDF